MQSEESPDYVPSDYEADSKVSPAAAQEDARLSFVRSAAAGDVSRMRDLLANSDPSTPPDRYRKLLSAAGHAAAEAGAVDVLRALAAAGLDVSAPVSAAPLQEELESTAGRKNLKLTSLIRLAAATALYAAAGGGHVEVVMELLDAGAKLDTPCAAKIDLRRAAPRLWDDDFERFEKDPTTTDKASAPIPGFLHVPLKSAREKEVAVRALEAAAAAGSAEVVSLLLDRGCDGADLRGRFAQCSALQLAVMEGRAAIAKLLLERCPSPPEARRGELGSPLEIAAAQGDPILLTLLLDWCPAPPAGFLDICLALAARAASANCVRLLLERACAAGDYGCAALLLDAGADPREACSDCAVHTTDANSSHLVALGASPDPELGPEDKQTAVKVEGGMQGGKNGGREEREMQAKAGPSALEFAALVGSAPLVRLLVRRGAQPERRRPADPPGTGRFSHSSALGLAASSTAATALASARALLALGADPTNPIAVAWESRNQVVGRSALHTAVLRGDLPLLRALLDKVPSAKLAEAVNAKGSDRQSCLYQTLARSSRSSAGAADGPSFVESAARLLLAAGADAFDATNAPVQARSRDPTESCFSQTVRGSSRAPRV
eukprot:tig00020610_g12087.t1